MMQTYICLLRGINVGGNKQIKMADLKLMFESLGFTDVQTLLQSGNVVCRHPAADESTLTRQLEAAIVERYGFESRIVIRTAQAWRALATQHPFSAAQVSEPSKVLVTFLRDAPTPEAVETLLAVVATQANGEQLWVQGREVYAFFPAGMGRTKLDNTVIERKLKTVGTGRNWNTVQKVLALVGEG